MGRILDALNKNNFKCVATKNPDTVQDAQIKATEERPVYKVFESPAPKQEAVSVPELDYREPLLFKYFIDGSERVTEIAHLIDPKNRYCPLFVAQIGIATTVLNGKQLELEDFSYENILMMPNSLAPNDRARAQKIIYDVEQDIIRSSRSTLNLSIEDYDIGGDDNDDAMAEARKKVLKFMHEKEIEQITRLAGSGKVTRDNLLMIDGSLEFYEHFEEEAFRNVVGVSKQFQLNKFVGSGTRKKHVGSLVTSLPEHYRTPAQKLSHRNLFIGTWYLRLHRADHLASPEKGVLKIEMFPENTTNNPSMDSSLCDNISSHILALRHPTTPSLDRRWASHLYPVHVTEKYAKTQFRKPETIAAFF